MPEERNQCFSEANASAVFFLSDDPNFNLSGYAAVVDIGGGTTDISFWSKRRLVWEDSVKFAGGDLVEVLDDLVKYVCTGSSGTSWFSYDIAMRKWPYVHANWDKKMEDLRNTDFFAKTFRTICLFYSGICYYIGVHLKTKGISTPISHVAFAGNGIRFLEIISYGRRLSKETLGDVTKLFQKMLSLGQGSRGKSGTNLIFSSKPKLEVAFGLVSENLGDYKAGEKTVKKMVGLDISLGGKHTNFGDWVKNNKASDFLDAKIDFGRFDEFISKYKAAAKEFFVDWKVDMKVESMPDKINEEMIEGFKNSLARRGNEELASSLFFEALKTYMKHQYKL